MIGLGTTLRCNLPPCHIWIVLSDPAQTGDRILVANLTSLTEDCVDDACILGPSDFAPYLSHETSVAYSRAQTGHPDVLRRLINEGTFKLMTPVPAATLEKILKGARQSRELSRIQKELLPPLPT